MVHTVKITAYTPRTDAPGALTFVLDGKTCNARCYADANLADGLPVAGTEHPVTLPVAAARGGIQGVYLIPSSGRYDTTAELIEELKGEDQER